MIDIHNHILINVDDGPETEQAAIDLLLQAAANDVTDIIITPHHYSENYENPSEKIKESLNELNFLAEQLDISINLYLGQEIRINPNLLHELTTGRSIPLNHSRYVLLEFSYIEIPRYTDQLIFDLQMKGFVPLIAHPERCPPLIDDMDMLYDLVDRGVITQVTAGSVTGAFGGNLKTLTLEMIKRNLVHVVASDAHNATVRPFMLKEAYQVIEKELGESYVNYLQKNASAILNNKELAVISPARTDYKNKFKKKKKGNLWGLF